MRLGDRIKTGIETLSRKANLALDEGRLRMDLLKVRRRRDNAARDLGYVVYRQSRGAPPAEGEVDALTKKMADADADMARIEDQLRKLQQLRSEDRGASQP
jgi:hypothetical protein